MGVRSTPTVTEATSGELVLIDRAQSEQSRGPLESSGDREALSTPKGKHAALCG